MQKDAELYAIFREASGGWLLQDMQGEFHYFDEIAELCQLLIDEHGDDEVEFWAPDDE